MALVWSIKRLSSRLWYMIILFLFCVFVLSITYKPVLFKQIQGQDDQIDLYDDQMQSDNCKRLCPYSSILTNDTVEFNVSHIRHFPNFVCPQNFRNLADWVYGWPNQFHERLQITTDQGKHIALCLPPGSIIYVRIWIINKFFDQVYPHLQNNFVLITGEGDVSSPTHMEYLERSDSKILHWFGQNGQYDVSRSKKFTHIPIGNLLTLFSF
jgi:hypothetical protein